MEITAKIKMMEVNSIITNGDKELRKLDWLDCIQLSLSIQFSSFYIHLKASSQNVFKISLLEFKIKPRKIN